MRFSVIEPLNTYTSIQLGRFLSNVGGQMCLCVRGGGGGEGGHDFLVLCHCVQWNLSDMRPLLLYQILTLV